MNRGAQWKTGALSTGLEDQILKLFLPRPRSPFTTPYRGVGERTGSFFFPFTKPFTTTFKYFKDLPLIRSPIRSLKKPFTNPLKWPFW
jgi:hypothetical protein